MNKLPPHDVRSEAGFVSCLLQSPALIASYKHRGRELFSDLRCQIFFEALKEMHEKKIGIDTETLWLFLKQKKLAKTIGGVAAVAKLADVAPSPANVEYYYEILRELAAFRKLLDITGDIEQRIYNLNGNAPDVIMGIQAELDTVSRILSTKSNKRQLEMWSPSDLLKYEIPPHLRLIGDNEIIMGYDGLFLMAGPGSSGKSLCGMTLALAGARGAGTWMGRQVHRKFKTMILQAENGAIRLKDEMEAIGRNHPEINIEECILISSPPEGGLPFHKADFRAAVRDEAEKFKPDLILIDTWAQVAAEDAAKEVVDKISEIRTCFGALETFPAMGILAHTKKPRAEEVRKGRGLINSISGSIALGNTARCVYMLLPWNEEMEEERIYWACVKLNNGKMYPASVWHRRFGTFFVHDDQTDPREFGRSEDDGREKISRDNLQDAFGDDKELTTRDLVKRLAKCSGASEATCYRAISVEGGYLFKHLRMVGNKKQLIEE